MPLRVAWHDDAVQQLATVWLNTDDRDGVTLASRRIERELADEPIQKSRPAGDLLHSFRIVPLEVLFDYRKKRESRRDCRRARSAAGQELTD